MKTPRPGRLQKSGLNVQPVDNRVAHTGTRIGACSVPDGGRQCENWKGSILISRLIGSCAVPVDMVKGVRESLHLERLLRFDSGAQPLESSKIIHDGRPFTLFFHSVIYERSFDRFELMGKKPTFFRLALGARADGHSMCMRVWCRAAR